MKKFIIFLTIIIAFLGMFWYIYGEAKLKENNRIAFNNTYEKILNKTITGTELATIINKSIDNNNNNEVKKNDSGIYLDNGENSMNIEIKFIDSTNIIKGEKIFENDINKFIELYNTSKFELQTINYHEKTKRVKYLYFEEKN